MANEIQLSYYPGLTSLYAVLRGANGQQRLRADTTALENYNAGNWSLYGIALTEDGASGDYRASVPAGAPAGVYSVQARFQVGGSRAPSDPVIGPGGELQWDGTAEATLSSRPTAAQIDAQLSGTHGAGSWLTGAATDPEDIAAAVWENAERTLTQSAAEVAVAVSGSDLTVRRGDTWIANLTGLGSIAGRTALWFTAKRRETETDAEALIQIIAGTGLVRLDGEEGTADYGSITVTDEDAGEVTIRVEEEAAVLLPLINGGVYDLQWKDASGDVHTLTAGAFRVQLDVTRAIQ